MKIPRKLAVACSILLAVAVWSGPMSSALAAQGAPAAAAAPSSTDYKIGVVDMDEVLKQYTKLKTQADALKAEHGKLQKEIDSKSEALTKEMEAIKSAAEPVSEERLEEIEKKLRDFRADFQRMDGELESKRIKLLGRTRQEVVDTIQRIGADEKYHLILQAGATVIYHATPIDITSKVIDKLNGAAPAAPAAPAPAKKQ